nr:hypothetical protein BaRGS_001382 [Batillaria attramentaria]
MASRTFVLFNLFDKDLGAYWQARAFSLTGVYLGFLLTSNSITLVIALQRCIIVISPLSAKRMPNANFKWEPSTQFDPQTNVTLDVIKLTDVYVANRRVWDIVVEICFNVFVPVTSLVVVIAANVIIAVRMRSVLAWRKDTAHAADKGSPGLSVLGQSLQLSPAVSHALGIRLQVAVPV